ncbi:tetratricopeptide (TPR) repeat protein [Methanocalculus alkaliphilus]|uniref:HEAT repeat domain-containing protein n=1 Tax=Methanocalculus alkaliphilus TaxID=768730 RepID=UPI00209E3E58|nr:tetratricopeptide (TPR) repeat protein [Methanocalculus alkaliphilus]
MTEEGCEQLTAEELLTRARLERDPTRKLFFSSEAIERNPDDPKAWIERTKALMKCAMLTEAEEQINEVLRRYPDDGDGWYLHGLLMNMMGSRTLAKESLKKAIGSSIHPGPAQYALGSILASEGQDDEALTIFDAALREDIHDSDAWYARGRALLRMRRYRQAIISFDHVLEGRPGDHHATEARREAIRMMNREQAVREGDREFETLREEADYLQLARILEHAGDAKAKKAAEVLISLGRGSTRHIRPLLSHDDPIIRLRALHTLLALDDQECADIFVQVALKIQTPEEGGGRKSADLLDAISHALRRMRIDTTPALEEAIHSGDENRTIRAIRLLQRTGGEKCLIHLLSATSSASITVIYAALTALGAIGDERAVDRVATLMKSPDPAVRERARAVNRLIIQRSLPALMRRYASADEDDRASLLGILGEAGGGAIPELLRMLRFEEDSNVREAASEALIAASDGKAIQPLIDTLISADNRLADHVRAALIHTVPSAVPHLMDLLIDPRRRVRERASDTLTGMGRNALPALIGAIYAEDPALRDAASGILIRIGMNALPALEDALHLSDDQDLIRDLISRIRKNERMERLLAEYRGEEPI